MNNLTDLEDKANDNISFLKGHLTSINNIHYVLSHLPIRKIYEQEFNVGPTTSEGSLIRKLNNKIACLQAMLNEKDSYLAKQSKQYNSDITELKAQLASFQESARKRSLSSKNVVMLTGKSINTSFGNQEEFKEYYINYEVEYEKAIREKLNIEKILIKTNLDLAEKSEMVSNLESHLTKLTKMVHKASNQLRQFEAETNKLKIENALLNKELSLIKNELSKFSKNKTSKPVNTKVLSNESYLQPSKSGMTYHYTSNSIKEGGQSKATISKVEHLSIIEDYLADDSTIPIFKEDDQSTDTAAVFSANKLQSDQILIKGMNNYVKSRQQFNEGSDLNETGNEEESDYSANICLTEETCPISELNQKSKKKGILSSFRSLFFS